MKVTSLPTAGVALETVLVALRSMRGLGVGVLVAWSSSSGALLFGVLSGSDSVAVVTCAVLA